jgi:hypothetical protein
MYDTVRIWIDRAYTGAEVTKETLFANTTHPEYVYRKDEDKESDYHKAYLLYPDHSKVGQGWDVWLFRSGIKIQGSPAKWLFGNNADTLTLTQAEESFTTLAEALQLPYETLLWGVVQRLDFSSVICMDYAPKAYYGNLDYLHKYRRSLDASGDSLYFKQTEKWVVFYDKQKDAEAKGMSLPEWTKGQNLLRYEVRYIKPKRTHLYRKIKKEWIKDVDAKGNFFVKDLLNEQIYIACIDEWLNIYERINKSSKMSDMVTTKRLYKPSQVSDSILAPIVAEVGLDCLSKMLEEVKLKNPHLTDRQASTAWRNITGLVETAENDYTDAVMELNIKMRQRAKAIRDRMFAA